MTGRVALGAALSAVFALEGLLSLSPFTAWLLGLPVMFYCAGRFHEGFLRGLKDRRVGLHLLASVSSWALFLLSTAAVFFGRFLPPGLCEHRLLSLSLLATLVNLGLWIESGFQKKTPQALAALARRLPRTARVLRDGREVLLPLQEIAPGDRVAVGPGETVPVDGEVVEGSSRVDESLGSGLGEPAEKSPGSRVAGGSVNKDARIVVAASGPESALALRRLLDETAEALSERRPRSRAVDPAARTFLAAVLLAAAATALAGALRGPQPRSLYAAAAFFTVLSCACPWGVALASPLALFFGARRASGLGIGIRNPAMLESFRGPDALVIGKTGVLTEGRPEIQEVLPCGGALPGESVAWMLAAGQGIESPFAQALRRYAEKNAIAPRPEPRTALESFPGGGLCATVGERRILLGGLGWLAMHGIGPDGPQASQLRDLSQTLVALAADGRLEAVAVFSDGLKPGIREKVASLRSRGVEAVLVSGDAGPAVSRAALGAGVGRAYAEALEEDKAAVVSRLRSKGRRVAVLGEGERDVCALSRSDLGLCSAGCSPLAEAASDFTLPRADLDSFEEALALGLDIRGAIRRNFLWMFSLHALMIPASATALYLRRAMPPGIFAASAATALAAVLVNSARLARRRTPPG